MTKFLKEWKKWISTKPKTRRTSSVSALNYSLHAIFDLVSLLQNNLRKIKLDKSVGRRLSITKYFSSHDCFNCVSDWLREWHKFSANNLTTEKLFWITVNFHCRCPFSWKLTEHYGTYQVWAECWKIKFYFMKQKKIFVGACL